MTDLADAAARRRILTEFGSSFFVEAAAGTRQTTALVGPIVGLDRALEELELARIGTIHAFCGDLLHERPVEAGIDPLFEVASEEEAETFADEAFEAWFQRVLSDPPEGVRRILRRRSGWQSPREQLRGAMNSLREHRDFPEPWRRDPFDRNGAIHALMDELTQL